MVIAIVSLIVSSPLRRRFKDIVFNSQEPKFGDWDELIGRPKWRSMTCPAQPLFFFPALKTVTLYLSASLRRSVPTISDILPIASCLSTMFLYL